MSKVSIKPSYENHKNITEILRKLPHDTLNCWLINSNYFSSIFATTDCGFSIVIIIC